MAGMSNVPIATKAAMFGTDLRLKISGASAGEYLNEKK